MKKISPIKKWRSQQTPKITRKAFGQMCKPSVDSTTIWRWESKYPPPSHRIIEISALIGCDPSDLLSNTIHFEQKTDEEI